MRQHQVLSPLRLAGRRLAGALPLLVVLSGCTSALQRSTGAGGAVEASRSLTARQAEGSPVPSVVTLSSDFERIVIVRLKNQTDVLEGLERAVEAEGIRNAVILSGAGSLTSYHVHAVSNSTFPTENVFYRAESPEDITAVTGYVVGGRVHAHITFSNDKRALAGHLEPGTRVFTFAAITLGVLPDDVDLERLDDKDWR